MGDSICTRQKHKPNCSSVEYLQYVVVHDLCWTLQIARPIQQHHTHPVRARGHIVLVVAPREQTVSGSLTSLTSSASISCAFSSLKQMTMKRSTFRQNHLVIRLLISSSTAATHGRITMWNEAIGFLYSISPLWQCFKQYACKSHVSLNVPWFIVAISLRRFCCCLGTTSATFAQDLNTTHRNPWNHRKLTL